MVRARASRAGHWVFLSLVPLQLTGCILTAEPEEEEALDDASLALGPAPAGGFRFGKDSTENAKNVPIRQNRKWEVVYSVPLEKLDASERVAVRGEVQLTTCQLSDIVKGSPCNRVTPFSPEFAVKIVLGSSSTDAIGKDLSATRDMTCTHFRHHCAVAIDEKTTSGLQGDRFVNLVVSAKHGSASSKDVMEVNDQHGGLYVTRMGKGADANGVNEIKGHVVTGSWMQLDMENKHPRKPHVALQATVQNAQDGDVLDVEALIEAVTRGGGSKPAGCRGARDPLMSHQVLVSKHGGDPLGTKLSAVTAKNGSNCKLGNGCNYRKSGAIQLGTGTPSTVWVSVISWGGRSCSAPGDEWKLGGQSSLRVRKRRG